MVQLNNLDDDCLIKVLDRLPPNQLFKMLRVNKRINRLANVKIRVKIMAIELYSNELTKYSSISQFNLISNNQVLVLGSKFKNLEKPSTRAFFLSLLAKFNTIRSIDFRGTNTLDRFCKDAFPNNLLLEVIRLCPELQCIKLGKSLVKEDEWNQVFDLIGNQIVHFAKNWFQFEPDDAPSQTRLLEMIAEKCPNIKRVDWCVDDELTSDLVTAFKMLPKSCWVTLDCPILFEASEDVFDELDLISICDWSLFGRRVNRLSKLKVCSLELTFDDVCSVEFAGLKKLTLDESFNQKYKEQSISCLVASRFPKLEKFTFFANDGFTEDDYDKIFKQMVLVKKLAIDWKVPLEQNSFVGEMPQSAIFHLKNLEIIKLDIWDLTKYFNPKNLLHQLEQYVNKISSLKKLTVVIPETEFVEWKKMVEDKVKLMKLSQNCVEITLINKSE